MVTISYQLCYEGIVAMKLRKCWFFFFKSRRYISIPVFPLDALLIYECFFIFRCWSHDYLMVHRSYTCKLLLFPDVKVMINLWTIQSSVQVFVEFCRTEVSVALLSFIFYTINRRDRWIMDLVSLVDQEEEGWKMFKPSNVLQ